MRDLAANQARSEEGVADQVMLHTGTGTRDAYCMPYDPSETQYRYGTVSVYHNKLPVPVLIHTSSALGSLTRVERTKAPWKEYGRSPHAARAGPGWPP